MFNDLWEESPRIQKERTEYYARGKGEGKEEGIAEGMAQGMAQGALQTARSTLVRFVQARFPELTELAQEKAKLCTKLDVLEYVTQQLFTAPDRQTAQQLLTSISQG